MTGPQTHARPRVLVTSAAGRTASPAVLDLLKKGFPVRAFVRRDDARASCFVIDLSRQSPST